MISYAAHQTSPQGPKGIASYPWQWLIDSGWITYLDISPGRPANGLGEVQPAAHFFGLISPPILLAGVLGLLLAAIAIAWRRRWGLPGGVGG